MVDPSASNAPAPAMATGDKHMGDEMPGMGMPPVRSFDELDAARELCDAQEAVEKVMRDFSTVTAGIMSDYEATPTEKAANLQAATGDLGKRLKAAGAKALASIGLGGDKASKTEGGVTYQSSDYAHVPDPDKPSTWKLRLAEGKSGNYTAAQVGRAITAMHPGGFRGERVQMEMPKGAVMAKISAAISSLDATPAQKADLQKRLSAMKDSGSLRVFKDRRGAWRWAGCYSNNLYDRDGEVIPYSEHKAYVDYVDRSGAMPELWLWHTPGTALGRADIVDVTTEGFAIASGTFHVGKEVQAERLAALGGLGVSHGFEYVTKDGAGAIYGYRSFEISALPIERAANEYTAILVGEEPTMPLTPEKKDFLVGVMGADFVAGLESRLADAKAAADERGIAWKEVLDVVAPPVPAEPPPAAKDADPAPAAPPAQDQAAALAEALAPLATVVAALQAELAAVKAGQEDVATRMAKAMTPGNGMYVASQAGDNLAHGNSADAKALKGTAMAVPEHLKGHFELLQGVGFRAPMALVADAPNTEKGA